MRAPPERMVARDEAGPELKLLEQMRLALDRGDLRLADQVRRQLWRAGFRVDGGRDYQPLLLERH
jgi:hypothetical protein